MTTKIQNYYTAKQNYHEAKKWAELFGKSYSGGGGGSGYVHGILCSMTMYHQERDGAKNYHDSSKELNNALAKAVGLRCKDIINDALQVLKETYEKAATECQDEINKIQADMLEEQP